ncbi:MAG: hypothetical protein HUJ51_03565, partial [Eggerthellaceae bacterium]|nr:hypothetical protein [Eggerthellaceae bacterium]
MPEKVLTNIKLVIAKSGLEDSKCISFHNDLCNSGYVLNRVMEDIASASIKNLTVDANTHFNCRLTLVNHIKSRILSSLLTNYVAACIWRQLSTGILKALIEFCTCNGLPDDIQTDKTPINIAFIAATTVNHKGNITGIIGTSAFGNLGYSFNVAEYTPWLVAITDHLQDHSLEEISNPGQQINCIVE